MTKRSVSSRSAAPAQTRSRSTTASGKTAAELDALHDAGGDLTPYMDDSKIRRPGREVQRVNVDFPLDLLRAIDREAQRLGVNRQAFIKIRLADGLTAKEPR